MKNICTAIILLFAFNSKSLAQQYTSQSLPNSIYTGKQGPLHVQGVVVDQKNGFVYFSFTDKLIKTDLSGKLIGSVTGFLGHLGDLDFSDDGKIYGSLEFKNDAIGKGIKKELGGKSANEDGFYIAIFEASKIVRPDMDAEKEDLIKTVYIPEAVNDYKAQVKVGDKIVDHRFACSGIDGVAFAPEVGKPNSKKKFLYVAYGIYGDNERNDNDNQVILQYDVSNWDRYAQHLTQDNLHHSGPEKPKEKYFVRTGNTRYGVQNLAYDATSGNFYAAVYQGSKPQFPNYDLFVIDGHKKPFKGNIISDGKDPKVKMLSLVQQGPEDPKSGIRGWRFEWGSTGLCPLGGGLFYISHNEKTKDGQQQSTIYKYRWIGDEKTAFELVK